MLERQSERDRDRQTERSDCLKRKRRRSRPEKTPVERNPHIVDHKTRGHSLYTASEIT